jgi:hypothetical protein
MKLRQILQKYSFFLIKLAAFQASGAAYMKQHFKSWSWIYLGTLCIL